MSLNDIPINAYVPKCLVRVVSPWSFDAIKIYNYIELASRVTMIFASLRFLIHSLIQENWYAPRTLMAFRRL